mgnify:CR=1 FL=1
MSESSFSTFVQRNKFAIIGAVGAVSVGLLALYYYLQQAESTATKDEGSDAKKSKKKKKKTKAATNNTEAELEKAESDKKYPHDNAGLPKITEEFIASLTPEEKDTISGDLKVDGN